LPNGAGRPQFALLKTIAITLAALLIFAALGAGCTHYEPKPLSLSNAANSFDRRSLTNADLQAFISAHRTNAPLSVADWDVDSLTLAAIFYHPSLQLARAQSQTAAAGKRTAAARPNPTISLSPGYDFSAVTPANPWIPGATFDVPIETAGKRGKRILQAQHLAAAAQLAIMETAWQIRSNIHAAAIDLWSSSERERLIANQLNHQSALLRLLEQRLAAGALAANELLPIQVAQARLRSEIAAARAAQVQARARLSEAIGISVAALPNLQLREDALHIDPTALAKSAELREAALRNRVDLLAALERYEAAQAALRLEIAKQYPDVRIGSGYQWDQGDHKWNVLLSLELPILNRNQGPIAEAEARRTERAVEVIDAQARAIAQIDRAHAMAVAAREEITRAKDALENLRKQTKSIADRLAVGAADQTELATAAVEENAAGIVALEAQTRALMAEAELEAALQIPSSVVNGVKDAGLASE
jgi:cobalt-zinc-cadmium efflux system outer membrane protein